MIEFLITLATLLGYLVGCFADSFVIIKVVHWISDGLFPYDDKGVLLGFLWIIFATCVPVALIITLAGEKV